MKGDEGVAGEEKVCIMAQTQPGLGLVLEQPLDVPMGTGLGLRLAISSHLDTKPGVAIDIKQPLHQ